MSIIRLGRCGSLVCCYRADQLNIDLIVDCGLYSDTNTNINIDGA